MSTKKCMSIFTAVLLAVIFTACDGKAYSAESTENQGSIGETSVVYTEGENGSGAEGAQEMRLIIGDTPVSVSWEDNPAVEELKCIAAESLITMEMSMYGGFEQVGSLGSSLPRDDVQTTTQAGDIVLYSGNQIVVFYGSNSWAYTRLGRIEGMTAAELKELLGNGDINLTITSTP